VFNAKKDDVGLDVVSCSDAPWKLTELVYARLELLVTTDSVNISSRVDKFEICEEVKNEKFPCFDEVITLTVVVCTRVAIVDSSVERRLIIDGPVDDCRYVCDAIGDLDCADDSVNVGQEVTTC
jgi:hypothetical protein